MEENETTPERLPKETAPDGVLALVLSIVGLLLFQPLCIVSLVLSLQDKKKCQALGVAVPGGITAAVIISILGVALLVIGLVVILILVFAVAPEFIDGASN